MKKSNKTILWSIVSTLLLAVILCAILTNGFLEWNRYCVFGHDYGENNKCIRCGKDKPIENEQEALVTEQYSFTASAKKLMANNGEISLQAANDVESISYRTAVPTDFERVNISDNLSRTTSLYVDLTGLSFQSPKLYVMNILSTSEASLYLYVDVQDVGEANFDVDIEVSVVYDNSRMPRSGGSISSSIYELGQYEGLLITLPSDLLGTVEDFGDLNHNALYRTKYSVLPTAPTKTGYTFTGWYTDAACTNKYTAPTVTSDITLYAGFRANTYSVKFNANGGSGTMNNLSMTYDQAKNLTAIGFTKDHYRLKGWSTSANGSVAYSDKQSVKNLTATDGATVELFAVWERSEVAVTFVSDGNTVATTWIAIGTKATLPTNPTKEGHTFIGWYFEDGSKYETQNISEDITLTARFEIIRCTVTFIVDGEVYATYVCDWGTSLADALSANDINPILLKTEDEYSRNF